MQLDDFPYVILALAPFAPVPDGPYQPQGMPVDLTTLDAALEAMAPILRIEAPKAFCPGVWIEIAPTKMKHFRPDGVVEVCGYLKRISEAGKLIENARSAGQSVASIADKLKNEYQDIPLDIRLAAPKAAAASSAVDDLLSMVAMPESSGGGINDLNALKTQCEQIMAGVLQAIFAAPEFRGCEAAWRGLETLLKQGGVKEGARVKVVIAAIGENNFEPALDGLAEALAASAPQLVLLDLALDSAPERLQQLEKIANFGDTLLAPTAVELAPRFFHIQSWAEIKKIPYLKHFLEDAAYAKWRKLQENPIAIWLAPCINRFISRPRYGEENRPKPVFFQEETPLWLNPVWALGALVAQSVLQHGWPSRFTDYMTVRLTDLPVTPDAGSPMATQMAVADTRLAEFIQVGITPLLGGAYKDFVMMPKETTAGGYPLSYQLFVNQVLGFFMWAKENIGGQVANDLGGGLTQAFALYWQLTGHTPPKDISIEPQEAEGGGIVLAIGFTPPSSAIPGGQRLEFTFAW